MDPESPIGRMERTFWTVWYYITGAVNRFLRPEPTDVASNDPNSIQESAVDSEPTNITSNDPNSIQESAVDSEPTNITSNDPNSIQESAIDSEPTNITSNDPNSIQESTVDSEPTNFSQTEGDTSGRGVDEEQALATASLLSSFRPLVAWEVCTTDIDLKTDEESVPCKTQLSGGSESKASEGGGGTREEQLANAGNNDTGLFFAKDDKQEENIDQKLCTRGRDEMPENEEYEEHVNATLTGDAVSEDMEKSARGAEETEKAPHDPQKMNETIQVKEADDKMQLEDEQHLQAEDTEVKLCQIAGLSLGEEDNMHVEEVKVQRNEADEEVENSDGVPKLAFEHECDKGAREAENQLSVCEELSDDHRDFSEVPGFASQHVELQMTYDKSSIVSEDELTVVEQERVMAHWSESDNVEDAKEKEDENTVDEVAVVEEENVNEAANNQITDDAQEQRDNIKTVTEEDILPEHVTCNEEVLQNAPKQEDNIKTLTEEEDVLTERVACSEEVMQSATSELHTAEFTYREQDVAKDSKVQTKTKETDDVEAEYDGSLTDEQSDMKTTPVSVDESFSDQEAEEMLLNEVSNKESYTEIAHTATSVPVQPEGETGEEMSGEFKNIPPRICEGPAVVSQELNSQTCEETQEGVQEEEELPVDSMKTGIEQKTEKEFESDVGLTDEFNKMTSEPQDGMEELLVDLGKDEGLCDSIVAVAAGDGREATRDVAAEEVLVFADETFSESKVPKMTETSFQEFIDTITSEQNSNLTPSLLEDIAESRFLKHSDAAESKLLEDIAMPGAQDVDKTGYGLEKETAGHEMQGRDEMEILHLQSTAKAETGMSGPVESLVTKNQLSDEALENSNEEILPKEAAESIMAESKSKYSTLVSMEDTSMSVTESERSYTEETFSSISGRQEIIDEATLDLWIQTALSGDTDETQEGPENGQQTEPSNEDQGEISSMQQEESKEQLVDDAQEQRDNIKTVTEEDILPEHVTCNEEVLQNAPKREDNIKTLTEEEDVLTERVACSEEVMQSATSELHTAEFTYREQDVAKDSKVQTKTKETDDVEAEYDGSLTDEQSDMKTTPVSVDESFSDQEAEEMLLNEVSNKESYTEIAHTATSVPVQPEGETGEEMSGEFKNILPRICEGPAVVSQELNSQTCEETREGVPEYNNELGPDENTTQRFLEDCEEIQTSPLPEEVESKEPESLRNSGWSSGADCLLVRELMEEKRDIKKSFDSGVEDKGGILQFTEAGSPQETEGPLVEAVIQKSGHLVEEEEELPVDSMKTEIEQKTEKEFESDVGLTDEFNKMTNEPQDGMEELLVDLGKDEGLCDSIVAVAAGDGREATRDVAAEEVLAFADETFPEAKVPKMTETSFQEFIDTITSEQNSNLTPSLLEDIAESGFLKHSDAAESKLLEDIAMPGAQDVDKTGYGLEKETAGHEMQGRDEMEILHLQSTAKAETGMSGPVESLATKNQLSDEALENSNEEILPKEAAESIMAESKSKYSTLVSIEDTSMGVTESEGSYTEETFSSISGRQEIIDEATLDLWIQTALSGDTDETQEGPENGQQTEPSNEDQGEISSMQQEESKEQLVDLVSDLEMSSSTVESGFSDQSLGEVGTQSSETQLLKSTSAESFQGICDKLENVSESVDISEFTLQHSKSLMRETSVTDLKQEELVTATGFQPDSGVTSPEATDLNQESDKSQEEADKERVEPVELETGSQIEISDEVVDQAMKTDRKDTEEANIKSEITVTEDEPLEMSYSPDELKHTESGRSRSSSEALLEEEVELTESGSQAESCTESERKLLKLPSLDKPQPGWSEDVTGSLAAAEEAEQQATKSDEQMEVDAFVLDFTVQRSRIAVKNPRVRPPKDPRSLLHMPSLDPSPSSPLPVKAPVGMPLGGLGIGIKLPGLGAGFPVLKKTQRVVRDENSPETLSEETKAEEKSDTPKQEEAQRKPKWMPPRHPGFGNPLMSELKTKLKKTNE